MNLQSDLDSVSVLSKREREQNRSLRFCSITVRTELEQIEQNEVFPIRDLFYGLRTRLRIRPIFGSGIEAICSKGLKKEQKGGKAASDFRPSPDFVLPPPDPRPPHTLCRARTLFPPRRRRGKGFDCRVSVGFGNCPETSFFCNLLQGNDIK